MRRHRRSPASRPCEACGEATSNGKPYCIDHIDRLPEFGAVQGRIAAREAEISTIQRCGARAVDVSGECAREVLSILKDGAMTLKCFRHSLDMPQRVVDALLRALEKAGRLRKLEVEIRGRTEEVVALGDRLAEAS